MHFKWVAWVYMAISQCVIYSHYKYILHIQEVGESFDYIRDMVNIKRYSWPSSEAIIICEMKNTLEWNNIWVIPKNKVNIKA